MNPRVDFSKRYLYVDCVHNYVTKSKTTNVVNNITTTHMYTDVSNSAVAESPVNLSQSSTYSHTFRTPPTTQQQKGNCALTKSKVTDCTIISPKLTSRVESVSLSQDMWEL